MEETLFVDQLAGSMRLMEIEIVNLKRYVLVVPPKR